LVRRRQALLWGAGNVLVGLNERVQVRRSHPDVPADADHRQPAMPRQRVGFGHSQSLRHLGHREQGTIRCWPLRLRLAGPERGEQGRHAQEQPPLVRRR
jgi:hypothetical protein